MTGTEKFRVGVLTMSDKGSRGERLDESGDLAAGMLEAQGYNIAARGIVPDREENIINTLKDWCDNGGLSLIVTSGGNGPEPDGCHSPGHVKGD